MCGLPFVVCPGGAPRNSRRKVDQNHFLPLSVCRSLAVASLPPVSWPAGRCPAVAVVQPLPAGRSSDQQVIFNHTGCVWRCPGFGSQQVILHQYYYRQAYCFTIHFQNTKCMQLVGRIFVLIYFHCVLCCENSCFVASPLSCQNAVYE